MTIRLNGSDLTVTQVVAVARHGEAVALAPEATAAMRQARTVVEEVLQSGEPVYGLTTGVIELLRKSHGPETIAGLKDSSGDWNNTKMLLERFPGFDVFSGTVSASEWATPSLVRTPAEP